jgi:hypothetical protein
MILFSRATTNLFINKKTIRSSFHIITSNNNEIKTYTAILVLGVTPHDSLSLDNVCRYFLNKLAAHAKTPPCKNRTSLSPANAPNT